jgi:hypothetical protein
MRKIFLALVALLVVGAVNAQRREDRYKRREDRYNVRENQFGIGAELGIGTASGSKVSYGASVKYLHGVGGSGQTTFSLGWLKSSTSEEIGGVNYKTSSSLIPLLVGYRLNIGQLYVEPQAGVSLNKLKSTVGTETVSDTKFAFAYAVGGGYVTHGGFDFGIRFFNTTQSGANGIFVFRLGYNFSLGGGYRTE